MNYLKFLTFLIVVFAVIGVFVSAIAESVQDSPHLQEISDLPIQELYQDHHVYYKALQNAMNRANIDTWQRGEYGLSDRLNFFDVYVLDYDIESTGDFMNNYKYSESPDTASGYLTDFFNWVSDNIGLRNNNIDWQYGSMENLSTGSDVYVYPYVEFDPDTKDVDRWWIVQFFTVNQYGDMYAPDNWERWEIWDSGRYERIFQFEVGTMPSTDLYYVIDMVEIDRNTEYSNWALVGGLIGLTVSGHTVEGSEFAKRVERYGGVIYGDNPIDAPISLSSDGIALEQNSNSMSGIFRTVDNQLNNFGIFLNPEYGLFAELMAILAILFGLVVTVMLVMFIVGTLRGVDLHN